MSDIVSRAREALDGKPGAWRITDPTLLRELADALDRARALADEWANEEPSCWIPARQCGRELHEVLDGDA